MTWTMLAVIGVLTWIVATLTIDAWRRRPRRPSLTDRLVRYQAPNVASEAQDWLSRQK